MKLIHLLTSAALGVSITHALSPAGPTRITSHQTPSMLGRRDILNTAASLTVSAGALLVPQAAFADEYVPILRDMEQIYKLGVSLDRLIMKLKDPDQLEAALSGVQQFNKNPNFYTGYAKNFIMKTVKKGSDSDPRVGYIKQASTLISSLESVLAGGDALMNEKTTSEEAVKRVQKAQSLIVRFVAECGVEDEKLASFVSSHKY